MNGMRKACGEEKREASKRGMKGTEVVTFSSYDQISSSGSRRIWLTSSKPYSFKLSSRLAPDPKPQDYNSYLEPPNFKPPSLNPKLPALNTQRQSKWILKTASQDKLELELESMSLWIQMRKVGMSYESNKSAL